MCRVVENKSDFNGVRLDDLTRQCPKLRNVGNAESPFHSPALLS